MDSFLNVPKICGGVLMLIGIAISIFLVSYLFIISEKVPRAVVAVFGATLLIMTGVLTQEKAIHHIDWNTLGLFNWDDDHR